MVINRHGRNWRVAKSCDLQSQSPFVRCQDKKCNIGHSVQTDQNDENLSSSQFMSRIEQSVFPTTLLQLKIWFPADWLLQIPPPCSALPRSGGSVYNSVYKEQQIRHIPIFQLYWKRNQADYDFTWQCGQRTRLVNPSPSPRENPTSLSENQSGEIDQTNQPPDFHSWTTSLGLAYIPAAVGKIKSLDNWHITTTTENHEKTEEKKYKIWANSAQRRNACPLMIWIVGRLKDDLNTYGAVNSAHINMNSKSKNVQRMQIFSLSKGVLTLHTSIDL